MKSTTINVRINGELKEHLDQLRIDREQTTSEITRAILEEYFNGEQPGVEDEIDLLNSVQFLRLVVWVYEKRTDPNNSNSREELYTFKSSIELVLNNSAITFKLKQEFYKVLKDIERILKLERYFEGYFNFPLDENQNRFDYYLLEDFINNNGTQYCTVFV